MNDPPLADAVRARMKRIRRDIDQSVQDIDQDMQNMVDWKQYVRTYPWVCLGAATALGFLLVPKRSTAKRILGTLTELVKTGHPAVTLAPTATRRLVDGLLATVSNIAIREATAYVTRTAERFMATATDRSGLPVAERRRPG
jgi:hypothetical protein